MSQHRVRSKVNDDLEFANTIAVDDSHKKYLLKIWARNERELAKQPGFDVAKRNDRVKVGQVWRGMKTTVVSTFKVIGIENGYAVTLRGGKRLKVRLDRFKAGSRGYVLVTDLQRDD